MEWMDDRVQQSIIIKDAVSFYAESMRVRSVFPGVDVLTSSMTSYEKEPH